MKVFFSGASSKWAQDSGYTKEWTSFIGNLRQEDPCHSITDNRDAADVIIHTSGQQLGISSVKSLLRPLSNEDIRHFVWDWLDRPTGRMSGFYCSLEKSLFRHDRHRTVHYPIPFNELVEEFPQEDVIYNFGFVGGATAGLRGRLFHKLKPTENRDNAVIRIQGIDFSRVFDRKYTNTKHDYSEFLRKTRFILCPRGYGLGSDRLFELMKAGRVPVIISDRYTLPSGIDWNSCSIRIEENKIDKIPKILELQLQNWSQMARNARLIWHKHFSNEHFFKYMTNNIEEILGTLPRINLVRQVEYAVAIGGELAAHHLRPVLGRIRGQRCATGPGLPRETTVI